MHPPGSGLTWWMHFYLTGCLLRTNVAAFTVTDLSMPRLNGLALARHIVQTPALAHIPVLVMASHAGAALPRGYHILDKPFPLQLLVDTVHDLLA